MPNLSTPDDMNEPHDGEPNAENNAKRRLVLELSHDEARDFFLKADSYCSFKLPPYISFESLLLEVSNFIVNRQLSSLITKPRNYDDVNYVIQHNKDGSYAWRPIQLIHPVLYVALVHTITEKDHWDTILSRFAQFSANPKIKCLSLPVESLSGESDKAEQITKWWQEVEQKSLELALDYEYLAQTDVTDCYGAIYTHSIPWALHTKPFAKEHRNDKNLIGVRIDAHLQDMAHGQTNGIPQGAVLMDFIAEMVLGYADSILTEELKKRDIEDYQILRFRDDYRIFINNPQDGERILKVLTEIMTGLGLRLNSSKTFLSDQVIRSSIKKDKLAWMTKVKSVRGLQKHLLLIHDHADKFPNSGSLTVALTDYHKRLIRYKKPIEFLIPLISILVDIAYHSPRTYPIVATIMSKLLSRMDNVQEKKDVVGKVKKRFDQLPNTGHMQMWLQRVSLPILSIEYDEPICRLVAGQDEMIWNSEWIRYAELKNLINPRKIINEKELEDLPEIISIEESGLFMDFLRYPH